MYNSVLDFQQWHITYTPVYTNISGYVIGMIFGYLFYKQKGQQFSINKVRLFRFLIIKCKFKS